MASKKVGRLAGLAALAGLAYMNKDKLFGAKDKTPDAAKSESKSNSYDRNTDTGVEVMPSYAAKKSDDITVAGEGGFDAPADMSRVSRVGTPARTASSVKAPATSTAMPEGAFRGRRSDIVGGGRSGGRGGPEAGEEAAYRAKDAKQAELMSSYKPRRPDVKLKDTNFVYPDTGKTASFSNRVLKNFGAEEREQSDADRYDKKGGGVVKKMASGGMTASASKRGDGIAQRGKTRGKMC